MRRGFSLAEILIAVSLLALMMGIAVINLRAPRSRASSRGAAAVLASALRQSRQQAISEGRAVALGLASDNGSKAHSSGYYQLIGEIHPQIFSRTSFEHDFDGSAIYSGQYPGPNWGTAYPADLDLNSFTLGAWQAPFPQDHLVVFLPNGLAVSDLPLGDGAYRLVVARGFQYTPGNPAQLSSAQEPHVISIRPTGEVFEDKSSAIPNEVCFSGPGALLPHTTVAGNRPPALVAPYLRTNPDINLDFVDSVAPGSTATIPANGLLTYVVYAQDVDGDQLWCKWNGPGNFSATKGVGNRMVWDEANKRWEGQWTWQVPPTAKAGDKFTLECQVYDNQGGVTSPVDVGLAMPRPQVVTQQSIVCAMQKGVYIMSWDGTHAKQILRRRQVGNQTISKVRWSPDFSTLAVVAGANVWTMGPEGENLQLITGSPNSSWVPATGGRHPVPGHWIGSSIDAICWDSDSGTPRLYYISGDQLVQVDPDPSAPNQQILAPALGLSGPSSLNMHPGAKVLVTSDSASSDLLAIWLPDPATNNSPLSMGRVSLGQQVHSPIFDPTQLVPGASQIFFRCAEPGPGIDTDKAQVAVNPVTRTMTYSGGFTNVLPATGDRNGFSVSPDGKYFAEGMATDRLVICPVNAVSPSDLIDVTAVPIGPTQPLLDIDWGYY